MKRFLLFLLFMASLAVNGANPAPALMRTFSSLDQPVTGLLKYNPNNINTHVVVNSYWEGVGKGGGEFEWVPTSTDATNRFSCFKSQSSDWTSGTGRWKLVILSSEIDITQAGARGDYPTTSTEDNLALQNIIDTLAQSGSPGDITALPGNYGPMTNLIIAKTDGVSYSTVSGIRIRGVTPSSSTAPGQVKFIVSNGSAAGIILQNTKDCSVKNINFVGVNSFFGEGKADEGNFAGTFLNIENFKSSVNTVSTNRYAPHVGIAIDPFSSSTPTQYPGLAAWYLGSGGASENVTIENCSFTDLVAPWVVTPSDNGGGVHHFCADNNKSLQCTYGMAFGTSLVDFRIHNHQMKDVFAAFSTADFGAQTGTIPNFDGHLKYVSYIFEQALTNIVTSINIEYQNIQAKVVGGAGPEANGTLMIVGSGYDGSGTHALTDDGSYKTLSSGTITGSGTAGKIALWTSSTALGNSIATQTGTTNIFISGSLSIGATTNLLQRHGSTPYMELNSPDIYSLLYFTNSGGKLTDIGSTPLGAVFGTTGSQIDFGVSGSTKFTFTTTGIFPQPGIHLATYQIPFTYLNLNDSLRLDPAAVIYYDAPTNTIADLSGYGTPEGSKAYGVGSTYRRWDGGTGTAFYRKETGGATSIGWVAATTTAGTTINATDGYIPYRIGATAFGNSPIERAAATSLYVHNDTSGSTHFYFDSGNSLHLADGYALLQKNNLGSATPVVNYGFLASNPFLSTASLQQNSPAVSWSGQGWGTNTSTSQTLLFGAYVVPSSGADTPTGTWTMKAAASNSTPATVFTIKNVSGYTGTGTNVFGDDGMFHAPTGGGGSSPWIIDGNGIARLTTPADPTGTNGMAQIATNLSPTSVIAFGSATLDVLQAISVDALSVLAIGDGTGRSVVLDNGMNTLNFIGSYSMSYAKITNSYDLDSHGAVAGQYSTLIDSSQVGFYGPFSGQFSYLTNVYGIDFFGNLSGDHSILDSSQNIGAFGFNSLKNSRITNSINVTAIGVGAGEGLTGSFTNLVLIGDQATAADGTSDKVVLGPSMSLVFGTTNLTTALAGKQPLAAPLTALAANANLYQATNANLTLWQAIAPSAKQDADADLTTWAGITPGTGVGTALAVNVGSAGAVVVNGGALGTPSSGTLTSATGLPISTGVSGLGTGVATALAVNVGSAGAPVVNGGALGTPSSGTLTSATGLPISGLVASTSTALGVGSIELGHATDTTIARVSAGVVSVEGVNVLTTATGQALDSDLTTIAGLTATTDNFIQSKSSAWASRTISQVEADLEGSGLLTDSVGFRIIPQNSQSAAYTTVAADSGKHIFHPAADTTARTWTIDSNANVAYPVGTAITFVNETLGGTVTIAITSDTLLHAADATTGNYTLAASKIATALKITSTKWIISP